LPQTTQRRTRTSVTTRCTARAQSSSTSLHMIAFRFSIGNNRHPSSPLSRYIVQFSHCNVHAQSMTRHLYTSHCKLFQKDLPHRIRKIDQRNSCRTRRPGLHSFRAKHLRSHREKHMIHRQMEQSSSPQTTQRRTRSPQTTCCIVRALSSCPAAHTSQHNRSHSHLGRKARTGHHAHQASTRTFRCCMIRARPPRSQGPPHKAAMQQQSSSHRPSPQSTRKVPSSLGNARSQNTKRCHCSLQGSQPQTARPRTIRRRRQRNSCRTRKTRQRIHRDLHHRSLGPTRSSLRHFESNN